MVNQTLKSETSSTDFYENDGQDYISNIFDDTLLRVLSKFEEKGEICSNSLVSKKWLNLGGGLVRKVKVCDWEFMKPERILLRFPHVVDLDVDLILKLVGNVDGFYSSLVSDIGLTILAQGCKRLVKLELRVCEGSYDGIRAIGQCCQMLEELTFYDHKMDDGWLSGVSYCENLKSLILVSCKSIDGNPGLDGHLVWRGKWVHWWRRVEKVVAGRSRYGGVMVVEEVEWKMKNR
ncbi:F-box protein-like protein [Tanacetum coccineum]